jgi:hypothetical protein
MKKFKDFFEDFNIAPRPITATRTSFDQGTTSMYPSSMDTKIFALEKMPKKKKKAKKHLKKD